ncbi:MAG: hypothetical protein JWM32_852 [Verrucomicrobia bacterium]|nr:hypothetical protein [Verrucomicrobiota bacterium]
MKSRFLASALLAFGVFLLGGCDYDVPATAGPTRAIEEKLLGDWGVMEKGEDKELLMHVRKLDDFNYVMSVEADIYHVFHSDLKPLALVSAQDLNTSVRKYVYYTWELSADANKLTLRRVMTKVISDKINETTAMQEALLEHAADPKLLSEPLVFTRKVKKL